MGLNSQLSCAGLEPESRNLQPGAGVLGDKLPLKAEQHGDTGL
jgi:hypothetical protein